MFPDCSNFYWSLLPNISFSMNSLYPEADPNLVGPELIHNLVKWGPETDHYNVLWLHALRQRVRPQATLWFCRAEWSHWRMLDRRSCSCTEVWTWRVRNGREADPWARGPELAVVMLQERGVELLSVNSWKGVRSHLCNTYSLSPSMCHTSSQVNLDNTPAHADIMF